MIENFLYLSGIFYVRFLDHGRTWGTKTTESKTAVKGNYCNRNVVGKPPVTWEN
jgi:hypothetical protein